MKAEVLHKKNAGYDKDMGPWDIFTTASSAYVKRKLKE